MHIPQTIKLFCNQTRFKGPNTKSEIKILHTILFPDEKLHALLEGNLKKVHNRDINGYGLVIATDRRIIFFRKSFIGSITNEEIQLSKISSISSRKGLVFSSLSVTTSNNEATVSNCDKHQADFFTNIVRNLINNLNNEPKQAVQPVVTQQTSKFDELEKLFELKEKGIITAEEYEIEKQKILNKL